MIPATSHRIIDVAVFEQRGGWVFVGVRQGNGFYNNVLFSGKRKTLALAMSASKELAGDQAELVYCV